MYIPDGDGPPPPDKASRVSHVAEIPELPLLPLPVAMVRKQGVFALNKRTSITCSDKNLIPIATLLATRLRASTGYPIGIITDPNIDVDSAEQDTIELSFSPKKNMHAEGYELDLTPTRGTIRGADQCGVFYGTQTLLQLLPPEAYSPIHVDGVEWTAPCVYVADYPRFKWRGMMIDVSRHFFNKSEVETMLDSMAAHKLNVFHWHLCDDQGWRIEIKKYPKLTSVGAWRDGIGFGLDPKSTDSYGAGGRYGGFYTQQDIREVVAYAKERFITIVPEIEMPGHSTAALTAYPELSCTGGPFTTNIDNGVFNGVYCAGNDQSFEFLQNVLLEVFDLFPGKYVHIGGDEVPPDNWLHCPLCQKRMTELNLASEHDLQSYFISRMEKFVNQHNRTIVGWSEIRKGGMAPNAVLMDWIGGGAEAAREGHEAVMTPTAYCYFDYYQADNKEGEPKAQPSVITLPKVYSFNPIPQRLAVKYDEHILGGQANLWTEFIPSLHHLEYMTYPRLCAMSEVLWSKPERRSWESFYTRLVKQCHRLDEMGVNYRRQTLNETRPAPGM